MPQSTKGKKPSKPYEGFPLVSHWNGQWCKKIRGKLHYFGKWSDQSAALKSYERQRDALQAGRTPPSRTDSSVQVVDVCNAFLASKRKLRDSGELAVVTYYTYAETCKRIVESLGSERPIASLTSEDFDTFRASLAKRLGPAALASAVNRTRSVFKYGYDCGMLDKPVRFGPHFRRPNAKALRLARAERGQRLFTPAEIRKLLKCANRTMRAMIMLGINAALGNADIARLQHKNIQNGWLDYPRPKTGMPRRVKLWPETIAAIRWLPKRIPKPQNEGLVFVTRFGNTWLGNNPMSQPVCVAFTMLLDASKVKRPGLSFYALRHTFQTVAEGCHDMPAVRAIMGHVPAADDMSSVYREEMTDKRLIAATDHVKEWLFSSKGCRQRLSPRKTGTNHR